MTLYASLLCIAGALWTSTSFVNAQEQVIDSTIHHLRNTDSREWNEFAEKADYAKLQISFRTAPDSSEKTLVLRQYDVKAKWLVLLNGKPLGSLVEDEKDLLCYLTIPSGLLLTDNKLEIRTTDKHADDIRVGEIVLHSAPVEKLLSQSLVDLKILDGESGKPIPSRVTITNARGALQPVIATSQAPLTIRPGYVYTANGNISIGLQEGSYTLYATRGFEYSVDSATITVKRGDTISRQLRLRREVNTRGWAGSDTHVHTVTWSRHGDATSLERAITIAGEGIDLPIITDHNTHADFKPIVTASGLDRYYTTVTGNEVTTRAGHFNVFPVAGKAPVTDAVRNWKQLSEVIGNVRLRAVILNHARDIHAGFRPFDPSRHLAIAGMRLDGWEFPANAMEVINSGSQQTDQFQLTRDWFGMLNGGYFLTPVGASDSHDVSRFIVGQARTYIRSNDDDPGNIDVTEAVKDFLEGSVIVSFGLLANIEVNDTYGPGEIVPSSDEVKISVEVSGPAWARADKIALYANGKKIREESISDDGNSGLKWNGVWHLTMPAHDIFLVAIAEGPGRRLPYWPIAKPFQPSSREWEPKIFGLTGAVWLDGDRNGERNSARDYARDLIRQSGSDIHALLQNLAAFHESVAVQAAALLHMNGKILTGPDVTSALQHASGDTRAAFEAVIEALGQSRR